jgi:general secretion pathway protein E
MGVEPYLISSSVNAFLAQRLVRKICPHCITAYKPVQQELSRVGLTKSKLKKESLYKGKGCEKCLNTGYSGRIGIFELMTMTDSIRKLIMSGADASTIKDIAIKEGMKTLLQDGIDKAVKGLTTLEEVFRVS